MKLSAGKKDKKSNVKAEKKPIFGLVRFVVLLVLAAAFAGSLVLISGIDRHIEVANANLATLKTLKNKYDYAELESKANALRQSGMRLNVKHFSKNEAIRQTLLFADTMSKKYNATLVNDITTDNNIVTASMKMTVTPKNGEEFLEIASLLTSSKLPMIFVENVKIEQLSDNATVSNVTFEFILHHPFEEEGADLDADY